MASFLGCRNNFYTYISLGIVSLVFIIITVIAVINTGGMSIILTKKFLQFLILEIGFLAVLYAIVYIIVYAVAHKFIDYKESEYEYAVKRVTYKDGTYKYIAQVRDEKYGDFTPIVKNTIEKDNHKTIVYEKGYDSLVYSLFRSDSCVYLDSVEEARERIQEYKKQLEIERKKRIQEENETTVINETTIIIK